MTDTGIASPARPEPIFRNGHLELKRCRYGVMLYNVNDAVIGRSLQVYGEFCEDDVRLFRSVVRPGHTVLDIGANIGCHTLALAAMVGSQGRVLAFEPQRTMFQILCANLALNGLDNVEPHQAALGAEPGTLRMPRLRYGNPGHFGAFSFVTPPDGHLLPYDPDAEEETVARVALDDLDLPACQFMKIDVEGMEDEILDGAERTIRRRPPVLYVENNHRGRSPELVRRLLDLDYRCFWHTTSYFNPDNHDGVDRNVFERPFELNMVCVPKKVAHLIEGMKEVAAPDDWPLDG